MKFHLNNFNGCQLKEWTRNSIANDQREIPQKISKAELWFLCMTRRCDVLYKCMNFHWNICNGYQVIERTWFCDYLCYKGDNLKNTHARVMVLVHDTSSQCALQMYEVLWNIWNSYQVIERTQFCDGQTDRQTHRRTQGEKQYVSRPLHVGDIIYSPDMKTQHIKFKILNET